MALSLILLVGAGLLMGTFRRLATVDAGFEAEGVLLVAVDLPVAAVPAAQRADTYRELLERFRAMPGAQSASLSNLTPIGGGTWNNLVAVAGYTSSSRDDLLVYFNEVSDGYFATLRTGLIAGRDFDGSDTPESQRVALINATMAYRFFGQANLSDVSSASIRLATRSSRPRQSLVSWTMPSTSHCGNRRLPTA